MKKLAIIAGLISILILSVFSTGYFQVGAGTSISRLIWYTYDWELDEIAEELIIEDGGTYIVPLGVPKLFSFENSEYTVDGIVYFINSETSEREQIEYALDDFESTAISWEKAGIYEVDFFQVNIQVRNDPVQKKIFAKVFPKIAYADDEEEGDGVIATIRFNIVGENSRNPVIIVPGILGSVLEHVSEFGIGTIIWPDIETMALSTSDVFLNLLILNEDGSENPEFNIQATNIIKQITESDYWAGLISQLGLIEDQDLFTFPYDWRLDIQVISEKLKEKIDEVKVQTGAEKVDVVAHSMGGLLVKEYLRNYDDGSLGKFVDIATPHTGAPQSFKTISFGDDLGIKFLGDFLRLNPERVKIISQNMPAVYQLLPSRNYFDESDPKYRYYVFDGVNGNKRLNFDETKSYLKNAGRNNMLVDLAGAFHEGIDSLDPAHYGVETYNIVSCGVPTIGQFFILEEKSPGKYVYNIHMIDGDGTVPLKSAEAIPAAATYYSIGAKHATMPSALGIKELVSDILLGENIDASSYSNISITSAGCGVPDGNIVSFHSPIELHVYDQFGNHAGPNEDGDIVNEIDGVVYEVIEDNKFAFLPVGFEYTIKGNATDEGSFDVYIQELVNGNVASTHVFAGIPLTQDTQTEFSLGSSIPTEIPLDHDNDGIFESSHDLLIVVDGFVESIEDIFPPEVSAPISTGGSSRSFSVNIPELEMSTSTIDIFQQLAIGIPLAASQPSLATSQSVAQAITDSEEFLDFEETHEESTKERRPFFQIIKDMFTRFWNWIRDGL